MDPESVNVLTSYRITKDEPVQNQSDTKIEPDADVPADIINPNVMEGTMGINQTDTPLANIPPDDDVDAVMESSLEIHLTDSMKELDIVEPTPEIQMQDTGGGYGVGDMINVSKNLEYFEKHSLIELSRYSWGTKNQRYLNGCQWSPDGTCLLTSINSDGMHVIELPRDLYNVETLEFDNNNRPLDILQTAVFVKNGGTVYDYCWYPFMNSQAPETCCWLSTQQHGPIQMWDAFDGKLRCSYRGFDAVDEVEAALSCTFSSDATEIIGGYRKSLKIFRTDVPGRDFVNIPLKSTASCLATSETDRNLIAIGSWNCSVTIMDLRAPNDPIQKLLEHTGGVTCARFLKNGNYLLSGARKDSKLICWDLRKLNNNVSFTMSRNVNTNQTIYFDVSPNECWLGSGDTSGIAHVWDLKRAQSEGKLCELKFNLHHDCCNGISFHPFYPILATSSGQHHFNGNDLHSTANNSNTAVIKENSLIFWWYGQTRNWKIT